MPKIIENLKDRLIDEAEKQKEWTWESVAP